MKKISISLEAAEILCRKARDEKIYPHERLQLDFAVNEVENSIYDLTRKEAVKSG